MKKFIKLDTDYNNHLSRYLKSSGVSQKEIQRAVKEKHDLDLNLTTISLMLNDDYIFTVRNVAYHLLREKNGFEVSEVEADFPSIEKDYNHLVH